MGKLAHLALLAIITAGCSGKDLTGKRLTTAEQQALETCNANLQSGVRVRLEPLTADEARIRTEKSQISVTSHYEVNGREMYWVCLTTTDGLAVKTSAPVGLE